MKTKNTNNYLLWLIGSLITVIVVVAAYIGFLLIQEPAESYVPDYLLDDDGITEIEPSLTIPNFTLTDQDNNPIQLSDLNGRLTLISFGFTHCPDVCPITLGEFNNIRETLGTNADSLDYVFITVDGERDTPEVLNTYFRTLRVDGFIVGMTGTTEALHEVTEPFGVEFIIHEADQFGNYSVDHTAGMFLLDENGNWIRRYRYGTHSQIIADDIQAAFNN